MNDLDRLQILLPHWIEHQAEHTRELQTWAERIQLTGRTEVADRLSTAADAMQQVGHQLASLLDEIRAGADAPSTDFADEEGHL